MIAELCLNFVYAMIAFAVIYLAGKLITSCFRLSNSPYLRLFLTYCTGLLVILLIYSLIRSGGRTVQLTAIPGLLLLVYLSKNRLQKPELDAVGIARDLGRSFVLLIPVFFYQSFFYFDLPQNTFKTLHVDCYQYADYVTSLKLFGSESKLSDLSYFFPEIQRTRVPYHYAELWISAFFSSLFGISSVSAYFLVVTPLLITCFLSGLLVFLRPAFKSGFPALLVGFVCLPAA